MRSHSPEKKRPTPRTLQQGARSTTPEMKPTLRERQERAAEALASLGLRSPIRPKIEPQSHEVLELERLRRHEATLFKSIDKAMSHDDNDAVECLRLELTEVQRQLVALREQPSPRGKAPPTTPRGDWAAKRSSTRGPVEGSRVTLSPERRSMTSGAIELVTIDTAPDIEAERISKLGPKIQEAQEDIAQTKLRLNFLKKKLAALEAVKSEHERSRGSLHLPSLDFLKDDNKPQRREEKTSVSVQKTRSTQTLRSVSHAFRHTINFKESAPPFDKALADYRDLLIRRDRVAKQLKKLDQQIAQEAKNLGMTPPKLGLPPPKPLYEVPPLPNFGEAEQARSDSDSPRTARARLETKRPPSSL